MERRLVLNGTQVRVLSWIRAGCPDGVYEFGYSHRLSARALESRGLVKISGHGESWTVRLTDAGRDWKPGTTLKPPVGSSPCLPGRSAQRKRPAPSKAPAVPRLSAEELFAQVFDAGGVIRFDSDVDRESYEATIRASMRSPVRPHAKRLVFAFVGDRMKRKYEVRFTDYFEDLVEVRSFDVPAHSGRFHPLVRAYRDTEDWQYVSRDHLPRACRILQAIIKEAEGLGWAIGAGPGLQQLLTHVERGSRPAPLELTTSNGESYLIRVEEEAGRGAKRQVYLPMGSSRRPPIWIVRRQYVFIPTGNLGLDVTGLRDVSGIDAFRDGKSQLLEEQLPMLFFAIEVEDMYRRRRREIAEQERADRQARWEAAMEAAKRRVREDYLWKRLVDHASKLREVQSVRDYLDAVRDAAQSADVAALEATNEALAQLDVFVERRESTVTLAHLAESAPEPSPEDLKPYLGRWSPYGPGE